MKKIVVFCVVLAAAGITVAVAAATGSFDTGSGAPNQNPAGIRGPARIYLVGTDSMRVRGVGFKAGEHVRVTAKGTKSAPKRTATASASGTFVVRLAKLSGCDSVTVIAIGNKGSRASFNLSSFVCRD